MIKILIVDDEPLIRIAIRSLEEWDKEGIEIVGEAENGTQALEILHRNPDIDFILIDVDMPILNGLELAERIQASALATHMIFLSSFDSFEYARRAFKAGAQDYILKTEMDDGRLLARIKSFDLPVDGDRQLPSTSDLLYAQLVSFLTGDGTLPVAGNLLTFPLDLILFRPVDEASLLKRYADHPESFVRLAVDLLRQSCAAVESSHVFSLCISRYLMLLPAGSDHKAIVGEFIRNSTVYLDRMFEFKVAVSINDFSEMREQYLLLEETFAPMSRIVVRARRYIQEHFAEQSLDLATIAKWVGVSKNHLSWEFSKETGQSLFAYLSQVRVERAIKLLNETNLLTYEVAEAVGFKNTETFARVFKRVTGTTARSFH